MPNGTSAATADKPPHPGAPATVDLAPHPESPAAPTDGSPHVAHAASTVTESEPPVTTRPAHRYRKALLAVGAVAALAAGVYFLIPWINAAMNTISTDDAYVNGHVTYVAPRYPARS